MQPQDIDWQVIGKLLDWGLLGFALRYLGNMSKSMAKLNEKIAVLFHSDQTHEGELRRQDERITHIERMQPPRRKT